MNSKRIQELCEQLNKLRRTLIELEGDDPDDQDEYFLYPPSNSKDISNAEQEFWLQYPTSYRSFLELHNGWIGFWPDWSLVGIPHDDNKDMYKDIDNTVKLLPTVANKDTREKLPEQEKVDSKVILVTNHLIMGTDFNGSLLVFDRNRVDKEDEPEIAWVHYIEHVERRWPNFEALMEDAISDTKNEISELQSE